MQFFNALVDAEDTTFVQAFARTDWQVLSFDFQHKEGGFAGLTLEIRNPGLGLLAGKVWLWFSYRPAGEDDAIPLFFGRILGIPSSMLEEAVTVELVAKPSDFAARQATLADAMRVLPWYDEVFVDRSRRDDPDVVFEAYSKRTHIDPVTHAVTASDILIGEDALAEFNESEMLYDGFGLALGSDIPLRSVKVDVPLSWTQIAHGTVDLTEYLRGNWPGAEGGVITSFTLRESNWPRAGARIGDNWTVASSRATELYDLVVRNRNGGENRIIEWWDGVTTNIRVDFSDDYVQVPPGSIALRPIVLDENLQVTYGDDDKISSYSYSRSTSDGLIALNHLLPSLVAGYEAERPFTDRVSFTLTADVQQIVTLPGDDEALVLDGIRAANLSEPVSDDSDAEVPIGDPRRRCYVCTARGEQSLVHLLLLARAHLLRRARAVEITFAPTLSRLGDISLRKPARIHDPRLPGGQADGKIVAWHFRVNGDSGEVDFRVTIGCAVGNGGAIAVSDGDPTWVEDDYIEDGYQERSGRMVSFNSDIGYERPVFAPNDDGIDFMAGLDADAAIDQALNVTNNAAQQRAVLEAAVDNWRGAAGTIGDDAEARQDLVNARTAALNAALKEVETVATFKLKSMRRAFETEYPIVTAELKVPRMIDLAAES